MIRADVRNQAYTLPDWVEKTAYGRDDTPDQDSYLPDWGRYIDWHTKPSKVLVSNDAFAHLWSSLSFPPSTLPSPANTKLSHPGLSLHTMIKSYNQVQHDLSTAYREYSIHRILHHPNVDCLPLSAILISQLTMFYSILYIPSITS